MNLQSTVDHDGFVQDRDDRIPELVLLIKETGRLFSGSGPVLLIGRGVQADLSFNDRAVSRKHCEIRFEDGLWILQDLDSKNGTTLNGRSLEPFHAVPLKRGDRIELAGRQALIVESRRTVSDTPEYLDDSLLSELEEYVLASYADMTVYDPGMTVPAPGMTAREPEVRWEGRPSASDAEQDSFLPHAAPAAKEKPSAAIFANEASSSELSFLKSLLRRQDKTFSEAILEILQTRDEKDSAVYRRAEVSRQLFSKILNDPDYQPTKNTAIQLAVGLQLNVEQTQQLLRKAGYALTPSSKTDLVVQYFIEKKIYNITFINDALFSLALPLLKTGLKL